MNFIHNHVHGLTAEQYWGGMILPVIVADPPEITSLSGFETHTMVLKDISLSGSLPEAYSTNMDFMRGKEGDTIMVNGQVNPVLGIKPGQIQRWHILNGSNARFYKLSLEGHSFYLVGTDGGLLDKPYEITNLLLSPGERVDILVKANAATGYYRLISQPYARHGSMSSAQITLLSLQDQGVPSNDTMPVAINPSAARISMDTSNLPQRKLVLSMSMGRAYINGQDFDVNPYTIMSELGTYEVWEIVNQSGMDHPFHQHVNSAQVLSVTGGDPTYASLYSSIPAMKDVVIVPKWGSVKLLVPIMDYDGMTMFHCHIVEHEDIGMMGMWHIMPSTMPMDLMIMTSVLPDGQLSSTYNENLSAMGGMLPYTWSVSSGSLPDGLVLNPTGSITGTPTKAGQYSFEIMVRDDMSAMAMLMLSINITNPPPAEPLAITTSTLAAGKVRHAYTQTLTGSGGIVPYTWSISAGALPGGMTLNSATGMLSGIPTKQGNYSFTVRLLDNAGTAVIRQYTLKISK